MKELNLLKNALLLAGLMACCESAFCSEVKELYRGARAQAMGNAFVAVADDEQAIYLNPAGLAGQKKYGINYFALGLEGSLGLVETALGGTSAFSNLSGDSLNVVMGRNVFAHAQFSPTITMSSFGFGLLVDEQIAIRAENKALPQIVLGYQQTNGFQVAWGTSIGRRRNENNDFRIGVAGKLMWRRGGYRLLTLTQMINVSRDTLHEIAGNYQRGYGFDLGLQYVRKLNNRMNVSWGLAWSDIGNTKFGDGPDPQPANLSSGVAATYQFSKFHTTLAYDLRHMNENMDWKKKSHFGAEVGLPLFRLYAGFNQAFLTYGVGFDAWLMKITALSYSEEQGAFATQDGERRYMLQVNLKVGI